MITSTLPTKYSVTTMSKSKSFLSKFLVRSARKKSREGVAYENGSYEGTIKRDEEKYCDSNKDSGDNPYEMMLYAVQYKDSDLLEKLLSYYSFLNINKLNEDGIAVIHFAAMVGSTELITLLKKYGADLNLKDIRGNSPLHYSNLMQHYDFSTELTKHGGKC